MGHPDWSTGYHTLCQSQGCPIIEHTISSCSSISSPLNSRLCIKGGLLAWSYRPVAVHGNMNSDPVSAHMPVLAAASQSALTLWCGGQSAHVQWLGQSSYFHVQPQAFYDHDPLLEQDSFSTIKVRHKKRRSARVTPKRSMHFALCEKFKTTDWHYAHVRQKY